MNKSRRGFFGKLLGVGAAAVAPPVVQVSPLERGVVQHGDYTLTWEGWRTFPDTWSLHGFWRATRKGDTRYFLYSTTGGHVHWAMPGAALNFATRGGWDFLAPDTPQVTLDAARKRALTHLIDAIDAGDFLAQLDHLERNC